MPSNDANGGDGADGIGNGVSNGGGFADGSESREGFNPARDSQKANEDLGFQGIHDAMNAANMTPDERQQFAAQIASMTTEDRLAMANTLSDIAAAPPEERNKVMTAGLAVLSKMGLVGAIAAGLIGWATSPKTTKEQMQAVLGRVSTGSSGTSAGGQGGSATNGDYRDANGNVGADFVKNEDGTETAPKTTQELIEDSFNSSAAGKTANTAWEDWAGQKSGLDAQAATLGARGDDAYNVLNGMAQAPNQDLNALRSEIQRYGTSAFQEANAGRAMADIQQQSSSQLDSASRNMARMGVNPASGRMAAMSNQNALQTAAAKAGAGNASRLNDQARYVSGLNTVNTAANADRTQRMDMLTNANKLGATGFGAGADVAKMGLSFGTAASNAATAATNAASNRIQANNETLKINNQQGQYDNSNDFWPNVGKAAVNNLVNSATDPKTDWSWVKSIFGG